MPSHVLWRQAADDVHVATVAGEFAGFVAADGGRFLAHDPLGRRIAAAASLGDARDAVDAIHVPPASLEEPRLGASHRTPRRRRRDATDRKHPVDIRHR